MLRMIAIIFGIVLIFVGIAGFLPTFTVNDLLFGYLMVNPFHNLVHIVTGVFAIMAATSLYYTRLYFQIFGVVYTLIAIVGFFRSDLIVMHVNMPDNILHLVIGVVSLYLGFADRFKRPY